MKGKKRFTSVVHVIKENLDELNHVNNVEYLKYLQEAAIQHWYDVATTDEIDQIRWIAKKHIIEYFKPAFENDELIITTWIEKYNSISTERHYQIHRGNDLIVEAQTLWIALDSGTLKPKRLSKSILAKFDSLF